ncbi:hypothetical protein [Amantichitinum ursilacus]|uniref:Uncharacterized protein n=1 Tax=Amantichitinum ursilacus TaxID=857265 RepID=A0A0N0XK19_9NEIS|nr:hypothetical protein [Amantichitinum ursilacus]KPC54259.1 hypothetical protein WG78_06405 [Amantichitinum ursilacus]
MTERNKELQSWASEMLADVDISALPIFDAAEFLDDEAVIAAYLAETHKAGDVVLLDNALKTIERARAWHQLPRQIE